MMPDRRGPARLSNTREAIAADGLRPGNPSSGDWLRAPWLLPALFLPRFLEGMKGRRLLCRSCRRPGIPPLRDRCGPGVGGTGVVAIEPRRSESMGEWKDQVLEQAHRLRLQAERLRVEADRLRVDANRLQIDASRLRLEAVRLEVDANRLRADAGLRIGEVSDRYDVVGSETGKHDDVSGPGLPAGDCRCHVGNRRGESGRCRSFRDL